MACKTLVFAVLVLAVVFYATSAQADLPGVVATQTVESLHYSAKQAMALARAEWGKQPLPGTQGNITEPIMGTLSYAINNITLAPNPTLPDPVVSLNPTLGYQFFISGVSFGLTADFNYSAPTWKMSGTGLADIVITNLTMSFNVLVKAVNGKFNFSVSDCTALISDVKVVVSGGAAWMQPWMSVLKSTIISEIEAEIVNVTVTYVEQMNTFLQMAPTRLPVMNMVIVDMTLTQDPVFTSSDVSVFVKGEIVPINDPTAEAPFSPAPMPRKVTGQMLEVMVSDYVFNTAGLALFKGGFLQYNVTDQLLPSWSPIRLNTSTWTFLLPELASKYPNMAMVATVAATQGPKITFAPKVGINAVAQGGIFFYVLPPGDLPAIPVFTLGLNLTTSLLVSIVNDSKIAGQLGSLTPSVSLQWSSVGDIPVSLLSSGIQMLVSALVPVANEALAQGYPLPSTPGLKLVNATIGYGPDYMYVSSSVNYQPPTVLAATTSMANLRRPATPITIN